MYPTIPFTTVRERAIDLDSLRNREIERVVPPGLEQRRDSDGKYLSHQDLPDPAVENR